MADTDFVEVDDEWIAEDRAAARKARRASTVISYEMTKDEIAQFPKDIAKLRNRAIYNRGG